jgi:hypothetical protein
MEPIPMDDDISWHTPLSHPSALQRHQEYSHHDQQQTQPNQRLAHTAHVTFYFTPQASGKLVAQISLPAQLYLLQQAVELWRNYTPLT